MAFLSLLMHKWSVIRLITLLFVSHSNLKTHSLTHTPLIHQFHNKYCVIFAGASVKTDTGPDSEAHIAPHHDDYEDKEYDHDTDERHAETQHTVKNEKAQQQQQQPQQQRNGNDQKTNTPV